MDGDVLGYVSFTLPLFDRYVRYVMENFDNVYKEADDAEG